MLRPDIRQLRRSILVCGISITIWLEVVVLLLEDYGHVGRAVNLTTLFLGRRLSAYTLDSNIL